MQVSLYPLEIWLFIQEFAFCCRISSYELSGEEFVSNEVEVLSLMDRSHSIIFPADYIFIACLRRPTRGFKEAAGTNQ